MKKPFDKIKILHLYTFCNILIDAEVRDRNIIKRKYLERSVLFDETLSLLEDLKIVSQNSNELIPSNSFSTSINSLEEFKNKFLAAILSATGDISEELNNFLLNFQINNKKIFFRASEFQKIKFSNIRNLLIELDFISVDLDNSIYFVNPDFVNLFLNQINKKKLSPESLKKKQLEKETVGLLAERAVINFELKRLTSISVLLSEIEHTSQINVFAGYDIKSFEDYLDSNSNRIERFIEVKAVSPFDYKFYWSRNEIEIAKVYGEMYYLYLLPVYANNSFEFDKIIIVNNPFMRIYSNGLEWEKEEECLSFSKNMRL